MSSLVGVVSLVLGAISCGGFFTLQPNEARVLILFGAYKGTCVKSGFHWTNPFYTKKRISPREASVFGSWSIRSSGRCTAAAGTPAA